ncbi:FMN-binding [actinobacterium SCGC AAA044-D11]
MKRGLLIGVGTLGGLGAVFAITPPQFGTSGPSGLAALPGRATSSSAPVDAAPSKAASAPTKNAAAPVPAQTKPAAAVGVSGTFDGNTASTRWGPVQVRIVVKDGKIVAASALKSPDGDSRSRSISQQAIPYLVQETLAAQSAQISGVGGASYTSNGWYTSLQSALKKAGL